MQLRPLAAALLCAAPVLHAQEQAEPVIVTAARFQTTIEAAPVNVTVIDAAQIARSGAGNLADVLRSEASLHVSDLLGAGGLKAKVDLGGFGASGAENTLILLNGRRLNDVDLAGANLAAIPLGAIERIEIMQGSGTVLYGDNATSGVINIVTKSAFATPNRVMLGAGSFGAAQFAAQGALTAGNDALALTAAGTRSDGYRAHNDSGQASFAGEWSHTRGEAVTGLRASAHYEDVGLPGALTEAQYKADPTQMGTFTGTAREQRNAVEAFWTGPQISAELAYSKKEQHSVLFALADADLATWSFTPRYAFQAGTGSFVTGIDLYSSTLDAKSSSFAVNASTTRRDSAALYATGTLPLSGPWAVEAGGRVQRVTLHVDSEDLLAGTSASDSRGDTLTAFDAGVVYHHANQGRSYARLSDTFRFPVLDEIWSYTTGAITLLKPQRGRQFEVGTRQPLGSGASMEARIFSADLLDEIGFDSATYANVNLDPTRHEGADLAAHADLNASARGTLGYSYRKAVFRDGANEGKFVPEIPRHRATAAVDWHWDAEVVHFEALYTGERYFGDDFANEGKKMSDYGVLNTAWTHRFDPRTRAVFAVRNLTDEKIADTGFFFAPSYYYYYPLPGRSFSAEFQADF